MADDGFKREIAALRMLSGSAASGFTPALIEEPQELDHASGFMGTFKMTRLTGTTITWYRSDINNENPEPRFQAMAHSAGVLLARFHNAAEQSDSILPPPLAWKINLVMISKPILLLEKAQMQP